MTCAICRLHSVALYRNACAHCNTARLRAAREFIHAAEAVRLMTHLAGYQIPWHRRRRAPVGRGWLEHAVSRMHYANQECVRLGMWPDERSTKRPPWFYGDERSNTR